MNNTHIFDNYPQPADYIPCNRTCECHCDEEDILTVGATTTHIFRLNFSYAELCDSFIVTYKNGLENVFAIDSKALGAPYSIEESDGRSYITVTLSPELTSAVIPHRDTFAQMKLFMKDGTVLFGDLNKLKVINTIGKESD